MEIPEPILAILPAGYREALRQTAGIEPEELRLRAGQAPTILRSGREQTLCTRRVTQAELGQIVSAACEHSCYAVGDKLREGFLTLPGGHRLGLCGTAATRDGLVLTLRELSSLAIRIAHQPKLKLDRVERGLTASTLLIGPPGSGKTTLLRGCIRLLSDGGQRVSLADERCEVAACYGGVPQLDVGSCTDVLSGCPKSRAMLLLLRTMNPQWIAVDEITAPEDVEAAEQCAYCGVKLLATAHAGDPGELERRPLYKKLLQTRVFQRLLILDENKQIRMERMD